MLCCQPEPFLTSLSARTPQLPPRRPCRTCSWIRAKPPRNLCADRGRCNATSLINSHVGLQTVVTQSSYFQKIRAIWKKARSSEVCLDRNAMTLGSTTSQREPIELTTARTLIVADTNFAVGDPKRDPRALQTSECHELLNPTRTSCLILAQRQPGKLPNTILAHAFTPVA